MAERIVCDRCKTVHIDVPGRDYNDGAWYCSCGGSLEIKRDTTVTCECCGDIVELRDAGIGDFGEYFCPDCYNTYLAELDAEMQAIYASQKRVS